MQQFFVTVSLEMEKDVQMVVGPRIWEISFCGGKESTDFWKCPLATENLQLETFAGSYD